MKFKKSIGLILMCLLFITPIVMAEPTINSTTITIKVIPTTNWTNETTLKIEFRSDLSDLNNKDFIIKLANGSIIDSSGDLLESQILTSTFYFISGQAEFENIDYFELWNQTNEQLITCKIERGQFESQLNSCLFRLGEYEGVNASDCKTKLDECTLTIKEKDLEIASKNKEIEDLNDEKEETKNQRWFYGVIGVIIGIIGLLFYQGKLGKEKAKDKSQGEFNPRQSG